MKTKNKVLAMVEIAVVLCSVLVVALPAIAADQTSQEVTASANAITTAPEDDFVLDIYGNANEDDTIDMRDLTYVKLIFFGKKPETELADAKYDGKINPLDFIQIKLIIVGKEKELALVDSVDRIVTVKKPVKRVILLKYYAPDVIRIFGVVDKIVGVSGYFTEQEIYYPELSKLPSVGRGNVYDYEAMLSLNPDLVLPMWRPAEIAEQLPGIPVVDLTIYKPETMREDVLKLGYIFGKRDEAVYYFDNFHDKYIDSIKAQTEKLSEEKRPKVYLESWHGCTTGQSYGGKAGPQEIIDLCGGRNIFADVPEIGVKMDPEAVIERNPDVIVKYVIGEYTGIEEFGYGADDPSEMKALRESIMNRPELANVAAVKTGRVYIVDYSIGLGINYPIGVAYWAKWFHPDLFDDLDPQAIHQEYLTEFVGLDFNVYEHGVFVYPPLE